MPPIRDSCKKTAPKVSAVRDRPAGVTPQPFQYSPLDPNRDEIRVLEVLPDEYDRPLRCAILQAVLRARIQVHPS